MLFDAHAHLGNEKEQRIREHEGIYTLLCGTNPVEWRKVLQICKDSSFFIPTIGLHPWHSANYFDKLQELELIMNQCQIIGEIGMDNQWCDVPLGIQEEVFLKQLALAEKRNDPVILHTKGQERQIVTHLKDFNVPYIVHWYSCQDYLEEYLNLDCYFTIGPDIGQNEHVQKVAKEVPLNRLFVETDGMNAVSWALGRTIREEQLPVVLQTSMQIISEIKAITVEAVEIAMEENFKGLFGGVK